MAVYDAVYLDPEDPCVQCDLCSNLCPTTEMAACLACRNTCETWAGECCREKHARVAHPTARVEWQPTIDDPNMPKLEQWPMATFAETTSRRARRKRRPNEIGEKFIDS